MKILGAFLISAVTLVFAGPCHAQSTGTTLVMQAHWDNRGAVQGTVLLAKASLSSPDTVIATKSLSNGRVSVTVPLDPNSVYNVTLLAASGAQLLKFPITTALINPSNLSRAEIDFVIHSANNALASARIDVSMNF